MSSNDVIAPGRVAVVTGAASGSSIGVTVLCPGAVSTTIASSARNRPASTGPATDEGVIGQASMEKLNSLVPTGRSPEEVTDPVVDAVRESRFHVLTSTNGIPAIRARFEAILAGTAPTPPLS